MSSAKNGTKTQETCKRAMTSRHDIRPFLHIFWMDHTQYDTDSIEIMLVFFANSCNTPVFVSQCKSRETLNRSFFVFESCTLLGTKISPEKAGTLEFDDFPNFPFWWDMLLVPWMVCFGPRWI